MKNTLYRGFRHRFSIDFGTDFRQFPDGILGFVGSCSSARPPSIFTFLLYRPVFRIFNFFVKNPIKNAPKRGPLQGPPADTILERNLAPFWAPFWTPEAPKTIQNRFRRASERSLELQSILHAILKQKVHPGRPNPERQGGMRRAAGTQF